MSSRKPRLTIFSKLLIVILIVAPIAYFGSTYLTTGEFNIENPFKSNDVKPTPSTTTTADPKPQSPQVDKAAQNKIDQLESRVKKLEGEIQILKAQVNALQK